MSRTLLKPPPPKVAAIAAELQSMQRQRAVVLKSRNMQANRLQAVVAGTLGYSASMPEKDRLRKFVEASALIKAVAAGTADHPMKAVIKTTLIGVDAFNDLKDALEKEMVRSARLLPVAGWVGRPEQRGFGLLFLAIVVGETGNLANYATVSKFWRRLSCAPWGFEGRDRMGATWRSGKEGKLPAAEWESYGYSPRRRSIAYLIGEGLVKQNGAAGPRGNGDGGGAQVVTDGVAAPSHPRGPVAPSGNGRKGESSRVTEPDAAPSRPGGAAGLQDGDGGETSVVTDCGSAPARPCGPYRHRYDTAKAALKAKHPEYPAGRCHLHGMLLATKLLLKNLWVCWNGRPARDPRWLRG